MKHTSVLKLTIILLLLGILTSCGMKVPTWQEQYDLGVRYLSEGNYEEAIIAFTAAIEIDPNYTDTYLINIYRARQLRKCKVNIGKGP